MASEKLITKRVLITSTKLELMKHMAEQKNSSLERLLGNITHDLEVSNLHYVHICSSTLLKDVHLNEGKCILHILLW